MAGVCAVMSYFHKYHRKGSQLGGCNAPAAFTLHVLAHVTSVARLLTIATSLCFWAVVVIGSLWGADLLVPFCKQFAARAPIALHDHGNVFCCVGAIIAFGLALYDFGYTSRIGRQLLLLHNVLLQNKAS